ncbi:MAG: SulP family inorganic anion transporter [Opitutales bacterium]|nr:SulP family inorganic anion transporter [Opitutales bacterium]
MPLPKLTIDDTRPDPLFSIRRIRNAFSSGGERSGLTLFALGKTLREYRAACFAKDLKAGFNVALLDFPQGMAYAMIAGLPFMMGIFASAVASFVGPLLASSRYVMLGPSNAIAVLTLSGFLSLNFTQDQTLAALPLLLIMVGVFMLVGALLRVASVINYISRTVITGYITAAAFLILCNQVRHVLGVHIEQSATFFETFINTLKAAPELNLPSVVLSAVTFAALLLFRKLIPKLPYVALTLALMTVLSVFMNRWGYAVEPLSHESLQAGYWPLSMPHFSFDMVSRLSGLAFALAFLSLLESASIAKTLAAKQGDALNLNQQMLSMGVANISCAFTSGMPVSGSLTRSMLNCNSGARSPVSSMVSGALLTVSVLLLAPYIGIIPKAALSVLIITIGVSLLNKKNIRMVLGTTNNDAAVFICTFVSGLLFPLNMAIYIGVGLSVLLFMKKAGSPYMVEYGFSDQGQEHEVTRSYERPGIALLHVEGDLFFGSSDMFLEQARRMAEDQQLRVIIIRLRNAHNLDASCAMAIDELLRLTREKGRHLIVSGAHPEVIEVFRNSGLLQDIGGDNVFGEDPNNPTMSTCMALKRAQDLAGKDLEVRLFVSENRAKEDAAEKGETVPA